MEEETLCSSLPDDTDSVLQQPLQDSWTPVNHQYTNGDQDMVVFGEAGMQPNQLYGTDQLHLFPQEVGWSPEEAEQWDQVLLPVRPMSCTSALSVATVQWDLPAEETPSLMTDNSLANELEFCSMTSLNPTPLSLHQCADSNAGLFILTDREEQDAFDSHLLLEGAENGSEPCDAADVKEPTTQEKEDSTLELVDCKNEIPLSTDSEEEEGNPVTSERDKTVDLINSFDESEDSLDVANSFVYSKLEEEQEEPCNLLTEEGNSEKEQTLANGVENDDRSEEGHKEEEPSVTSVSYTVESYLCDEEVPGQPLQIDDAGLTVSPDKLIHLLQAELPEESLHSGNAQDTGILHRLDKDCQGQSDDPEMCTDVDQNMHPEQPETVGDKEETSTQAAEDTAGTEHSQEILEMTNCLKKQECVPTTLQDGELSPQRRNSVSEPLEMWESEQIQVEVSTLQTEEQASKDSELLELSQHLDQLPQMELTGQSVDPEAVETADKPEERAVCSEAEEPEDAEKQGQVETLTEQNEQSLQMAQVSTLCEQLVPPEKTVEPEATQPTEEVELTPVDKQVETSDQAEGVREDGDVQTVEATAEESSPPETAVLHMNGAEVDRDMVCRLAERLYQLDGIQRVDVVKHLDKDNNFSRAVGEEYLKFFDFTGQSLDHALRSFLKVVVLIGESQERERVLQHFTCRFHECNPESFSSSGAVLALTCALMLLNTDLHGQHVGKSMSSSKFVSNLDGMNDGENFNKDLLKSFYNSIKSEPLEWAVDEAELKSCVLMEEDTDDTPLRSKSNPFLDVPHDKTASVVKEGFLQRKLHADIDGKRTPWGKRGWKTFYGELRGMVLYLQKDDYRNQPTIEEVVSVHHSLAEQAAEYTKKPHVFRLQTADWRVFLFQASSKVEMNSWINRINLVSALHSSPPFPAAVGSQRKFFRPILPASQSAHTLERQLQSHTGMLESFKADLSYLQQNAPEGRKARAKELEEHRVRAEYLQHEMSRYEIYIQMLETWAKVAKTEDVVLSQAELNLFDKAICADYLEEEEEEEGSLKKSHSSPSLELELPPPTVIKVKRNISERRTYRKAVIPRRNKEA